MTDKIKEELEKEIEEHKENYRLTIKHSDKEAQAFLNWLNVLEAKLSQHLATKTEMIKDEIEFLETEKEQLRIIIKQKNEIITDKIYTSDEKKEARQYAKYLIPHILETIKIYDERLAKLNAEKKELKT